MHQKAAKRARKNRRLDAVIAEYGRLDISKNDPSYRCRVVGADSRAILSQMRAMEHHLLYETKDYMILATQYKIKIAAEELTLRL